MGSKEEIGAKWTVKWEMEDKREKWEINLQ